MLANTLGVHRDRDIRARITTRMDLWERGLHVGLLGDAEAEVPTREGRAASVGEEEDKSLDRKFYSSFLSGKLR